MDCRRPAVRCPAAASQPRPHIEPNQTFWPFVGKRALSAGQDLTATECEVAIVAVTIRHNHTARLVCCGHFGLNQIPLEGPHKGLLSERQAQLIGHVTGNGVCGAKRLQRVGPDR